MSKYSERLQEILKNANSKKITDKRRCVIELLELYDNQDALNEICKNTEQNVQGITNWPYIMHIVHKILLNETDRFAFKDSYNKAAILERQKTCILVRRTVQHANCHKIPLLKCSDIMPLILQILGTSIYEYYHETYIDILILYVLPFRIYQVNMLYDHWQELLNICMHLYKNVSSLTSKGTILDAMKMIVKYGCLYSDLYLDAKNVLAFLEIVFVDVRGNQEILAESSYKLTSTVCQQIASECRIMLCQFSESILPNIISLKSSAGKYELLFLFVQIHHPQGICNFDDGAYANNFEKWQTILKSMYLMVLKDFKADILPRSLIYLASAVFKQALHNPNFIIEKKLLDECDYEQPAKRRRIVTKMVKLVDMIIGNNPEEAWPVIQVVTVLLKQYPDCLESQDLVEFLKVLVDLLAQSCKEDAIMDSLYELAARVLVNEKMFSVADIENSNIYWDKIWDILLRSFNVNQNEISTHKLTQLFIKHNKIANPNALLKLYFTNVIKWSTVSLRTLIILCEYSPLPTDIAVFNINACSPTMNSNSVRLCLLKWALNIPWHKIATQIKIDELCSLLISITSKSRYAKHILFEEGDSGTSCNCLKNEENAKELFYKHIEQCYLAAVYKKNLFTEKEENLIQNQYNIKVNERPLCMKDILNCLMNSLCDIIEERNGNDDLHIIIMKIAIIAKMVSRMKQLNMIPENVEKLGLVHTMKNNLDIAYNLLSEIDPAKCKYVYLCNVTKMLNILYETSYDTDITKIIVSSATLDMLKNIFSLMNTEDTEIADYEATSDYYNNYNFFQGRRKCLDRAVTQKKRCNFCDNGVIRIQATKALTSFCCMDVGQEKYDIQIKLMNNLLKIDMYDLSRTVDFKMAITVLQCLSKYSEQNLWKDCKKLPLDNLLKLYNECYKDETAVRYIFNILPYFLKYATDYNCHVDSLLDIISQFSKLRSEKKYGFITHIEFIKCLSKIIYINPHLFVYVIQDTENQTMPVIESLVSSLINRLFIVRLQAINCIQKIYSLRNIDSKWKEILFLKIEDSVNKSFSINEELDKNMETDEKQTKIASSLLVLAAVISTNGTFQCRALQTMLSYVIDNKLEIHIIREALNTMTDQIRYSNLIQDNLSNLMTYWFNVKYSLQCFPWNLTQCKSEEEFYKVYINMLVFIRFQRLELSNAIILCNHVNLPFEQIVENIFPQILIYLLYCMNESHDNAAKKVASKIFHKLISNQDEFNGVNKFSHLFHHKFGDVLIYLIERLHDEDYLEKTLGERVLFATPEPPHFTHKSVNICIKYMEENFFKKNVSIQYVLAHICPNTLPRISMHLITNIYKKTFVEHKISAFQQYMFFCTLLTKELEQNYFDNIAMYIIKDVSYSLLHLMKMNDDILSKLACKYFYIFIKHVLPIRCDEVKEILNFIVTTLIPIVQIDTGPVPLEILKFLLIDQQELLYDAIKKLSSFPNVPIFQELRDIHNSLRYKTGRIYNLEKEIQHFLNDLVDKNLSCSIDDISHLKLQLSKRKAELQELYNKLDTLRGFAEDYASSILHQLIYKLIKLATSSDIRIAIEAAKCLGELGPADLTTMILYLEKSHVKETSDLMEILSYEIVNMIIKFLFQNDIELRKRSADVLYVIFSSSWGQKLLDIEYMDHLKTILNKSQTMLPLNYIQPFTFDKSLRMKNINVNTVIINDIINSRNIIWTDQSNHSYADWIIEVTCKIAQCFTGFYSENLIPICKLSTDFCELILPRIIFLIIYIDQKFACTMSACINAFFEYHFNFMAEANVSSYSACRTTNCDRQIVRCMLNIVNYIRMQIADNVPFKLNYMYIAKAAQYCSAFFTAILYAEMACENIVRDCNDFTSISKIDYIYELTPAQGKVIQNILRDTYAKIGDFDAIDGTGSSHLQDYSTRIQHYVHTHQWNKVILAQDIELSFGNTSVIREMANGLHQSGLQHLLDHFVSTLYKSGEKVDEDIQYECAWRLSNWNFQEVNQAIYLQNDYNSKSDIAGNDYYFYHYQALKYFHEGNEMGIQIAIENACMNIIKALKNISLENSQTIYKNLMQLQLIREIEELSTAKQDEYENVLQNWQEQDISNVTEFQYIEPILTQRTVMFKINDSLANNVNIKNALANTYLEISKLAAEKENLDIATRSLAVLAKQTDLPLKIQDQLLYQESLLARHRKDLEIGRYLLRNLMQKETLDANLRAQVLRVYGDWMVETKSENPQAVIEKYYLKSINTSISINEQTSNTIKNLHNTQVALARFADSQFEQICLYMKSSQFESLKECVAYSCKEINIGSAAKDKDVRRAIILNQRQNTNDAAELKHIEKERDNYLTLALQYYLAALQQSEYHNLLIFRIVALWLDNTHQKEVNDLLHMNLNKIPSFKFIPLVPQLAAHMTDILDEFSSKIYQIMERCSVDHPHHTLPILLALKNLYGDYEYNTNKKNRALEPRVLGARKLLQELTKSNIHSIVYEMDKLSHSLVMLANLATSSTKSGSVINMPKNQKILKVNNFKNTLVPTVRIAVKPSRNYNDIISISKYVETYETVGGLNTPKKLTCIGSDGIYRHQLVKGKDDLRQDAVMQQVFNVMNTLLRACKQTKRRKLAIRTYKVVPLTQRSGILEWCDNTMPIIAVLIGSGSAPGIHKKYYPKDYTANSCKEKLAAVEKSSTDLKLKVFMDCCAHMHPVMHHFFIEKYPSPETWFERRLAYVRSIATTSMAGYILGLGDRHLNNILIDQTTAEVIHIDFGIAFEQGKVLPIPETIPFRLTRNIEVAMGVSGVEGTLRHCCEKTLNVLRDQRQIIITLLQVLLYDPLFTWTITPAKAHDIQSRNSLRSVEVSHCSTGTNKTAERALLRIEQKLQGTEEGLVSSISGQVGRLIQQARDPINLCRLYHGWQPYL